MIAECGQHQEASIGAEESRKTAVLYKLEHIHRKLDERDLALKMISHKFGEILPSIQGMA